MKRSSVDLGGTRLRPPSTRRTSGSTRMPGLRGTVSGAVFALLFACTAMAFAPRCKAATFTVGEGEFLLDGKPFVIRCGEVHFARVPRAYWRHRLQMVKANGYNAVCAYLFWNYHEQEEGKVDFSGERDVAAFCRIAQEEGLWVVLRPGPYTCAEWDLGGLPWWLLAKDGVRMRSRDPKYLEPARRYIAEVGKVLAPLQVTRGGPILMVQAENEYGSYGDDAEYVREIAKAVRAAGFEVPVFQCNGRGQVANGLVPELVQVVNFGSEPEVGFAELRRFAPKGPLMCGEYYPAWFDSWGQVHHVKDATACLKDLEYMLQHKASFSMYMAHGGTSFGWWAGCNAPFVPETSSYDYDAPITEAGWAHPTKFAAIRDLFAKYLNPGETIPGPPAAVPVQKGECAIVAEVADLCTGERKSASKPSPGTLESLGVGYGLGVYRTVLPAGVGGRLKADVRDLGVVRLGGREIGYLDRRYAEDGIEIAATDKPRELEIVVEPMGRNNFGEYINTAWKGIVGDVTVDGVRLTDWWSYGVRWDDLTKLAFRAPKADEQIGRGRLPACRVYRFTAKMEGGKDTFIDMSDWKRGMVWLNGRALGRYWSIGPTQTCYAPGCWIEDGDNEIVIWDAVGAEPKESVLRWHEKPILDVNAAGNDYFQPALRKTRVGLDAWKGMKVAFLGDSVTDPCHVGCTKNYWGFLIEDLDLDAKVYGVSGHQWSDLPGQINRIYEAMDVDLDAIFVFLGTNDYNADVPLGEFFTHRDEEVNHNGKVETRRRRCLNRDLSTLAGRINTGLGRLKTEFPKSQIILMTPLHRAFFRWSGDPEHHVQPPESFPNGLGLYLDDYVGVIKQAGQIWSVPVIDLYAECGLFPIKDAYAPYFKNASSDRLHPNPDGHRRIARAMKFRMLAMPATFRD